MDNERKNNIFSATEETSVAFSDWTRKMVIDYSFTAKLIMSGEKLKSFYAEIATALLKYETVNAKTSWSGVYFQTKGERVAYVSISGKTIYLYLAADPDSQQVGKFKATDVSSSRKYNKTPSLFRIRGEGSKNHAIEIIAQIARQKGLKEKTAAVPVNPESFRADSLESLLARGLARILSDNKMDTANPARKLDAYADTLEMTDSLLARHGIYNEILTHLAEGEGYARMSQQQMLRSVDEIWVKAVEDCISSLDELIRNPNHFIAETEDILPIERTKRISGRSIAHLGRHTDYLSMGADGEYTPTKMLNVFREDSLLTYENKFLNTLINRLYAFVNKRYKVAKEYGADEKLECFEFENNFTYGEGKGKIKVSIAYSERNLDADIKNDLLGTSLWNRVERLNNIVTGYINSPFAKEMDRNFVHPPIMRTNAIIKNKYFRECLALWEFIESYNDAGYGILVDEKTEEMSPEYIKASYSGAAMQYLLFRHNFENGFGDETEESFEISPSFMVSEAKRTDYTEDFVLEKDELPVDDDLDFALRVALIADEQMKDESNDTAAFMVRSFQAKLRFAPDELKQTFVEICNEFLKYGDVELEHGHRYATLRCGRDTLAKITINGNVIRMYTSLVCKEIPDDFGARNVPKIKELADTPTCFKIDSEHSVAIAKELADMFAIKYELTLSDEDVSQLRASDYQEEPLVEMLQKGWVSFSRRAVVRHRRDDALAFFGPSKKEQAIVMAEQAERLAVAESQIADSRLATAETPDNGSEDAKSLAKTISGLIRPSGNYDKPTEYGIDDTAAFIKDVEEENGESEQNDGALE